jgi:hypothetical protein
MKKIHLLFLSAFLTIGVTQAQTNLIKGRVLDKNNFPLPGIKGCIWNHLLQVRAPQVCISQ